MRAANVPAAQGRVWLACGFAAVERNTEHWVGMTLTYFAIAVGLKLIPFVGDLLLILITPLLLAGALVSARAQSEVVPTPETVSEPLSPGRAAWQAHDWKRLVDVTLLAPARALFQIFGREEYLFPAIFLCILTLGTVMVVGIMEYLLTGGSIISGLAASSLSAPLSTVLVLRMLVLVALYIVLAMALLYLVPLTLFDGLTPMAAMAESFTACRHNAGALLWFFGAFLVPCIVILYVFALWHIAGYVLVFTLGLLAMPVFVAGAWCSYRTLYRS
jgi:hypothetical protein